MAGILPSQVPVGTILGNMMFVDEDSWDVDTDPELIVVSGTVTFTASVRTLRMPTFQTILVPLRFDCTFDNQGNLIPKEGNGLGVKLPATNSPLISEQDYTWRVDFNLREVATGFTVRLDSFNIQVPVGSTQDLSTLIPVSESPGTITIQGPPGQAATVSVGTTTTGVAGTNASVTQAGTPQDRILNFTIPRGPKGDTGDGGVPTGGTALQYLRKNAGNTALEYASLTAQTASPTPNTVALRNGGGQIQVASPGSGPDAANRTYVDNADALKADKTAVALLERAKDAPNKTFTVTVVPATATVPTYTLTKLHYGIGAKDNLKRYIAFRSNVAAPPVRETLDGFYAREGSVVIMSASGFWQSGEDNNKVMGLSILNGELLKGWDTGTSDLGKEAIVMMRDGSLKCYSNATTPAQVLADGGYNSWSWGAAMYKDGAITNFQDIWRYRDEYIGGKQMFGDLKDGTIIFMTFPGQSDVSGPNAKQILEAVSVAGLDVNNLYFLDAGGSVQSMVNGEYVVPSSDPAPRPLGDVIAFNAFNADKKGTNKGWTEFQLASGFVSNGPIVPAYRIRNGILYVRGTIKPTTGNFALTSTVQLTVADPALLRIEPTDALVVATGALDSPFARLWIQGGRINMRTPGTALSYVGIAPINGTFMEP